MKKQFLFIFFLMVSVCMRAQFSGKGSGTTDDPMAEQCDFFFIRTSCKRYVKPLLAYILVKK